MSLEPLHRQLILGWMYCLARQGYDGVSVSQGMTEEEDYRLGAYLLLAWAFDHGWKPTNL